MNNLLKYKKYIGSVEYSEEDNLLYGSVLGIHSLISYEGTTIKELIEDFHGAVDDYLLMCEEDGTAPEVSVSDLARNCMKRQRFTHSPTIKA